MITDDIKTRQLIVDHVLNSYEPDQALADMCLGYLIANQTFDNANVRGAIGMFLDSFDEVISFSPAVVEYLVDAAISKRGEK